MYQDNNSYSISRDVIDLSVSKYWYSLKFLPLFDSLRVKFGLANNITFNCHSNNWKYSYSDFDSTYYEAMDSEFKIVNIIPGGVLQYEDNGITYLPITSTESHIYAKCLIGTTRYIENRLLTITESNYLNYIDYIVGMTFIDFSISEKITNDIIDSVDENGNMNYENLEVIYFYEL